MHEEIHHINTLPQEKPFAMHIAGVSWCDGSYKINRRKSPVWCIEYVTSGIGQIELAGESYHPKRGEVYILPAGLDHLYWSDAEEPWEKLWFNAAGELLGELIRLYGLEGRVVVEGGETRRHFERILTLCREKLPPEEIDRKSAVIFHELVQELALSTEGRRVSPEAEKMRVYLDSHISEEVTLDNLAGVIFKSKTQAMRLFRAEYGLPPYEYLIKQRLRRAEELLTGTGMPIKEIAHLSGFTNEHYFSHTFKQRIGQTPSEFRRG